MEIVPNRCKIECIKKDDNNKFVKQQSKLTFDGIHKSYTNYDSYTLRQNEVLIDKPIYLGFAILELSKSLKYETYHDKYNPILDRKIYNYIIWIVIASY